MPAVIINFQDAAARRGRFRGVGTVPEADLSTFDTLACLYCGEDTPPAAVTADWSVIYRCRCKKVFRILDDGSAARGLRGRAFP